MRVALPILAIYLTLWQKYKHMALESVEEAAVVVVFSRDLALFTQPAGGYDDGGHEKDSLRHRFF